MLNRRISILAMIVLLVSILPAFAQAKPIELEGIIKAERPYGSAHLFRFLIHVYDAEIWTDAKHWSYDTPFALSITYSMSFSVKDLSERTLEEMKHVSTVSAEQEKLFKNNINKYYRDVKSGDRITALYSPPANVRFFVNGLETGSVTDKEFTRAFFDIWLSPRTSEPEMRDGLLGIRL